jgi:ParB family chromosome partitioning protein
MGGPMKNRTALGRGLGALIPGADERADIGRSDGGVRELPVDSIQANPEQPRTRFDEGRLEELAASLTRHGIIQPVVVRPTPGGGYRLIAGERRLRAARMAGLEMIPAIVRDVDEGAGLELALVENLQREDLDPIDEAHGYEALMEVSGLSQADVADRVGKNRSTVSNALRLLDLSLEIQELISNGYLSAGHGRAILAAGEAAAQQKLAERIVKRGLSVREAEALARGTRKRRKKSTPRRVQTDPILRDVEERLQRLLGTLVRIEKAGDEGTIRIEFYSQEELDQIIDTLLSLESVVGRM